MDVQFIIVGLIIGIALFYTGRRAYGKIKAARGKSACQTGCGCGAESQNATAESRRR